MCEIRISDKENLEIEEPKIIYKVDKFEEEEEVYQGWADPIWDAEINI